MAIAVQQTNKIKKINKQTWSWVAMHCANIETGCPRRLAHYQYRQLRLFFITAILLCRDASGVFARNAASLNLPGTAPHHRVQPMTTRAGVTAGTAPNAPPAPHQRRPHQQSARRLHRADKHWRAKQEGRDMEGQKLWLPRSPHAGADGRYIALLTGISAFPLGVNERERCLLMRGVKRRCVIYKQTVSS